MEHSAFVGTVLKEDTTLVVVVVLIVGFIQPMALPVDVFSESIRGRKLERETAFNLDFSETRKNTSSASSTFPGSLGTGASAAAVASATEYSATSMGAAAAS